MRPLQMKMIVLATLLLCIHSSPTNYTITISDSFIPALSFVEEYYRLSNYAIIDINNSDSILPNTHLSLEFISQFGSAAIAIGKMIEYDRQNKTFIIGDLFSSISTQTGIVGAVFNIAQLSLGATTSTLSDKHIYPYYSRMVAPNNSQVNALISAIEYYGSIQAGWDNVAVICTAVEYGIDISENFIAKSKNQFEIADYRQILSTQTNFDTEIRELVNSKARVFAAFILNIQWEQFLFSANDAGLIGDNYVWFTGSIISSQRPSNDTVARLWTGVITAIPFHPAVTPQLDQFVDRWSDVTLPELTEATKLGYDAIVAAALTIDAIDKKGMLEQPRISGEEWSNTLRSVEFDGLSGPVKFNEFGDLVIDFELVFYNYANKTWDPAAIYNEADNSLEFIKNVIFFSGSEQVPDLDIREPRAYWSCHSSKMKVDETGKTVIIHTPGSKDADDIDSDYHCDRFIDCNNLSDETADCSTNYTALFITFGIITGIMVFVCVILLIFVVVFGICLHYRRLRRVSPGILVLLLISMIMGFCSIYAWFGKPHPVACAFQPWLLALSSIGMISALCVKTFRIWRIFRKQFVKVVISDIQLVILWIFLMIPVVCILILWMIISTPTAKLQDFDGTEHYVCATGGFTGHPGGYIFFALVVAYGAIILLCGIFLTIVTRNTPSMYNESKLLAISIYNIGFLSAVIIPVFLVVQPFNPFIAWILRTVAILYAFSAPLLLQFIEPVLGIIIIDRCKNNTTFIPIGITTSPN